MTGDIKEHLKTIGNVLKSLLQMEESTDVTSVFINPLHIVLIKLSG